MFKAFGKDGWTDDRFSFEEFGKMKAEGKFTLGSVPVLVMPSGKMMCQSEAICRWASKQGGMYPEDADKAFEVDMVMATFMEILQKCPGDPDEAVKKTKREEFSAGWMMTAMTAMEKLYSETESAFLHDTLTCADLMMSTTRARHPQRPFEIRHLRYTTVNMVLEGQFDYVPKEYMDTFPKLLAAATAVQMHDLVVEYGKNYKN